VEHELQRVAVQEVDAVEGGILCRGVDLREYVVVLRDEVGTGGLRVGIDDGRPGSRLAEEGPAGRRRRTAERAGRRGSRVVRGDDVDMAGGVDAGLQIVWRQRRVELVQIGNLICAKAECEGCRRAAAGRGDGQRLAGQAVALRGEAELGQDRAGKGQ